MRLNSKSKRRIAIGEFMRSIIHLYPPIYKICLEIIANYGKIYYGILDKNRVYRNKLIDLKGCREGKSCFIIGNGPSLKSSDLDRLYEYHVDCFASNQIFRIYDNTEWRPTCYSVIDWKGICDKDLEKIDAPLIFVGDYYWRKHRVLNENVIVFYGNRLSDTSLAGFRYSTDVSEKVYIGGSVTYVNFQLATYMGYKKVYFLGMDNSYMYILRKDGKKIKQEKNKQSHFYIDENPAIVYSNKEAMDNCFLTIKKYAEYMGVDVFNATRGGELDFFERVNFDLIELDKL